MTFDDLLKKYREESESEHELGRRFERLMKNFLLTCGRYRGKIKNIWLWNNFPYRKDFGGKDIGIDIVAENFDGEFWAVQCKCYAETTTLHKSDVDTFISTAGMDFNVNGVKKIFSKRIWISTTDNYTDNAALTLKKHKPEIESIDIENLRQSGVDWELLDGDKFGTDAIKPKIPLDYQTEAIDKAHEHFKNHARGKLIMACGTGKTFTALKIAERETDSRGIILYLVPSISLISQTFVEWANNAEKPINALCICSDSTAVDSDDTISDVSLPLNAMTDVDKISDKLEKIFNKHDDKFGMTVIFSTYQSIEIVHEVQRNLRFVFDLVVCDEAHRTAAAVDRNARKNKNSERNSALGEHSAFSAVHDNNFICAKKRLYMTATPKMFSSSAQDRKSDTNLALWSMDNENVFGKEIDSVTFKKAIDLGRLSDYKVLVLTVSERSLTKSLRKAIHSNSNSLKTDEAIKIVGCINAMSKKVDAKSKKMLEDDLSFMHTALAFCSRIDDSKYFTKIFDDAQKEYKSDLSDAEINSLVNGNWLHVDGGMNSSQRNGIIGKLRTTPKDGSDATIISNARCLSEGVDIPALDAVIFLAPKKSKIEIVQAVGRAMRVAAGKKFGYIIIPVVIPMDQDVDSILGNSDFKEIWQIVNALRAHDERIDTWIEQIRLNRQSKPPKLDDTDKPDDDKKIDAEKKIIVATTDNGTAPEDDTWQTVFIFEELRDKIYARMVELVGNPHYWVEWAHKVKTIVERHTRRIHELIAIDGEPQRAFQQFLDSLQTTVSSSLKENDAVDMLAQHIVTRPVFEALFDNYSFANENPVSIAMQRILSELDKDGLNKDNENFSRLYQQVRDMCRDMGDAKHRQDIIIRLYDSFFKIALPTTAQKLGIVYTPVEVVDFILRSVNDVLQHEFHRNIADENVHILDPFTGTGTFIVRLIQSGLIPPEDLRRKYQNDLHANELVLLAYYIAAINIENAFNAATDTFLPFNGICLTDTFEANEKIQPSIEEFNFNENLEIVNKQINTKITIIVGNPPYSVGQRSANDNAQNEHYEEVSNRISATYAAGTTATNKNALYDSYIKAFRWASDRIDPTFRHTDRIGDSGVVAFVTNAGWLDGAAMDGLRKCFEKEFSSIYVFNLRGNARTQGETRRKEKDNVFGQGTRTPIAIAVLVKNSAAQNKKAVIRYLDIGDYLTRQQKLDKIKAVGSVLNDAFTVIKPNERGDWINQRGNTFDEFVPIQPDVKFNTAAKSFFVVNSRGLETNRDALVYNYSTTELENNIRNIIRAYEEDTLKDIYNFGLYRTVIVPATKTRPAQKKILKHLLPSYKGEKICETNYRPFCKQYLYNDSSFIHRDGQFNSFFPPDEDNFLICISGVGSKKTFSVFITNQITDIQLQFNCQCFPLYWYEKSQQQNLFGESEYTRRDGVTDFILQQARQLYGDDVEKADIFYYVYGFLHLPKYREEFAADLKKSLPRIFLVDDAEKFWQLSEAGRKLAFLHLNYETQPPPEENLFTAAVEVVDDGTKDYRVKKMKFADKKDRTTLIYNDHIIIKNIPPRSFDYVVNGRSPLEWIIDRYQVKIDKASGIVNDPNDWSREHGDEKYILNLILSCITVSLKTLDIVDRLPEIDF